MCGIAGHFHPQNGKPGGEPVRRMCGALRHRGPDDEGFYSDAAVDLGMRRLSIIDVGGGHQPLFNEDKSLVLIFNGEIYNFIELRETLEKKGHRFQTKSDGEVILHAFEEKGAGAFLDLNGMFAFCLWDVKKQEGYLVRDRIGVKPLYYASPGGELFFASEIKALEAGGLAGTPDPAALLAYLNLMYVPGPLTPFQNVRKLPPASYLKFSKQGVDAPKKYWELRTEPRLEMSDQEGKTEFFRLFESAVQWQSRSDVPVGVFLSGGIDSGLLTAVYSKTVGSQILTYNVSYEGADVSESARAEKMAGLFGARHRAVSVTWEDVCRLLPQLIWQMDEPHADSALVAAYKVSALAAEDVKVVLNGTGGDELFGGYPRYLPNPAWLSAWHAAAPVSAAAEKLWPESLRPEPIKKLFHNQTSDATYVWRLLQFKPYHLEGFFADQPSAPPAPWGTYLSLAPRDIPQRYMFLDLQMYLVDDLLLLLDKMTMAASIEGRVPWLDHRLVEWAFCLDGAAKIAGGLKSHLKKWLRGTLPDDVLDQKKQGFGAPVRHWMSRGLLEKTFALIDTRPKTRGEFFWGDNGGALKDRLAGFNHQQVFALLVLEIWCRLFIDRAAPEDIAARLMKS